MAAQKKFYYVATVYKDGKYYDYGITTTESSNLLSVLSVHKSAHPNLISVFPCETRKRMKELVEAYRQDRIENGTYMFSPENLKLLTKENSNA